MQPEKLGKTGQSLWDEITKDAKLDPAGEALLIEACRTADIIDRLSGALWSKNQEWMRLSDEVEDIAPGVAEIRLVVNPILGEVRQQRLALRQMIAHLKLGAAQPKTTEEQTKSAFDRLIESL